MNGMLRTIRSLAMGVAALVLLSDIAWTQDYPTRSVRVIVPTNPGGLIDVTARVVGNKLSEFWGQPVVIENRPGAAMIIGAEAVARSKPDGYTLLVSHDGTMTTNQIATPKLPYNPERDFETIALLSTVRMAFLVSDSVPAKSLKEFVAYAKAHPGKLNHAAGGTQMRLSLELFKAATGTDIVNIQHKGGVAAVTATMQGQTDFTIADVSSARTAIEANKVRALAVASLAPSPLLPGIPTADQSGVPGFEVESWVGAFAPAGTPAAIVAKIEADIRKALSLPDVQKILANANIEAQFSTGKELSQRIVSETQRWDRLVRERGIKLY